MKSLSALLTPGTLLRWVKPISQVSPFHHVSYDFIRHLLFNNFALTEQVRLQEMLNGTAIELIVVFLV
jgi:hypothetical protein